MECNKDDAIRAKELSEKKMAENDFEGARNYAMKAQKLYPSLENISQLLSVCDVHCSAKKKVIGVDKDWYAVLQIEQFVDESTVKKQYKRLALVLHPDKNRLPGAEAAFKLISEAHAILTDTAKKSLFDMKLRASASMKAPPHYMNRRANINQQYGAQSSVVVNNAFRNMNQHNTTPSSSVRPDVFWTCCAYCQRRFQYQRIHINKSLKCQNCLRNFQGCEVGVEAKCGQPAAQVPLKPGFSQPASFHQKVELKQSHYKVGGQFGKGSSASDAGLHGFASRNVVHPEPGVKTGSSGGINIGSAFNGNGDLKANGTSYKHGGKSNSIPTKETADLKNSRKRGRKAVIESSESDNSSEDSDTDDEELEANFSNFATCNKSDAVHIQRRSSRVRQNVSYKYNESDDDDFASPIKKQKESKISEDENSAAKATGKDKATSHSEGSLPAKVAKCDTDDRGGESGAAEKVEVESDIESESEDNPGVVTAECPDPEFYDFDKDREADRFKINQTWACYDEYQMPRYYAKITKVNASPFELSFKWFEAVPTSDSDENWIAASLPVGCGTFKPARKTEKTSERNTFSHQMMSCVPGKKGTLDIYPKEKEVWALFKDWDIGWSLNPENHKEFQYEIVEVLCVEDAAGIRVCYLDKVAGFVSLFQRSGRSEYDSFWIRPEELYRFSHRVSSSHELNDGSKRDGVPTLNGSKRYGVPVGSFELDPASLPLNPDDLHYANKAQKESEIAEPKCAEEEDKSVKSAAAVNQTSFIDLDD